MKVLILGDGLLGSELKKQNPWWDVWSRKQGGLEVGVTSVFEIAKKIMGYDVVINCIAHTDTYSNDRDQHWLLNFQWVHSLNELCTIHNTKLVHISSDYVYANSKSNATEDTVPVHHDSWYAYTKLLGDGVAQLNENNLIIRCGHKPTPFPYEKATTAVIGNFDYVDVVADMITELIFKGHSGLYNVGTKLKTIYDLAYHTNPYVEKMTDLPIKDMPINVSMDVSRVKNKLP